MANVIKGFLGGSAVKNLPATQETQETQAQSLGQEDPLEEGMATHSSVLAGKIPWTEEPGRLKSMRSQSQTHSADTEHTCRRTSVYMYRERHYGG